MDTSFKKRKGVKSEGIGKLAITGFIVGLAFALVSTIWAVYMDSFLHSIVWVGFLSAILTLISFLSYFLFIPLLERSNKVKLYSYSLLLFAITYILFAINTKFYFFIILAFILTVISTLRVTSFGIIVKDKSADKELTKNEGLMYTFVNVAWVVGPLIAGYASNLFGVNKVFILSAVFILIALIFFKLSKIKDPNTKKKLDKNLIKNFIDFFKNKDRTKSYFLRGGVSLWWALIYVFIPLYIIRNDLGTIWVGYFLFAVAVPLILFGYHFSKLATKIGFRKIFKIGFLIPAVIVLSCFFIPNVYVVLGLLALASVGLSMLEATTEAYFFDITKDKEESRFYGPYNTTSEVNGFVGKIIASTLLIFLPFRFIFILFSILMFTFFILSFKIKNAKDGKG